MSTILVVEVSLCIFRAPRVISAVRKLLTQRRAAAVRTVGGFRVSSVGLV